MACAWVTSGSIEGPERVGHADPSYIGLVGAHPPLIHAALRVTLEAFVASGDGLVAGVLVVVALQEMRRAAGECAPSGLVFAWRSRSTPCTRQAQTCAAAF